MNGVAYKDTFAGRGSALYEAITEGKPEEAKRIWAYTKARYNALLAGLSVPKAGLVGEEGKEKWCITADDATYDTNGNITKKGT